MMPRPSTIIPQFDPRERDAALQAGVIAAFVALALVLGGSTASGITANAVLQIAAVIAIAATIGCSGGIARDAPERRLLLLAAAFGILIVVQVVPLPPALWKAFPGREPIAAGLTALGEPLPWMPLSLAPAKTVHFGLALLVPAAMIVMICTFRRPVARVAIIVLVVVTTLSVLLGVAQVAGNGQFYLYRYSNFGSAVGFFANSNHFGTLMCVTMPLVAGLVARWRSGSDGAQAVSRLVMAVVLLGVVLLALLGIVMTKSVAAVLLALIAIVGSAAIVLSGLPRAVRLAFLGGVVAVVLAAAAVAIVTGASDLVTASVGDGPLSRTEMWRATANAIESYGAAGTGFGAFPQVFPMFEDPEAVTVMVANHAHNDLLEFVLEGGVPGVILLALFLVWFAARLGAVWLVGRRRDPLAQGGSIAVLIVLLHSLVDYPLRNAAIAAVFGLGLALLARQSGGGPREEDAAVSQPGRHLSA